MRSTRAIVWGSELSPFALKLRALLAHAGLAYDWLPAEGGRLRNYRTLRRIARAKRTRTAIRHPATTALDEYPLVPFLVVDDVVYYDTSAIARWLDERLPSASPLVPPEPFLGFVVRVIDEAFDEVGLYVVHHRRWVTSATTNDAGRRLAREFRRVAPPGFGPILARSFSARQTRRLPYLFSVAPAGAPFPSPAGFPATHALLDEVWAAWVDAVARPLAARPYLLGDGFTLADASVYGQLGMNLADPTAAEALRVRAPHVDAWLRAVARDSHSGAGGAVAWHDDLAPLLRTIGRTFVPLMVQNARAYEAARAAGETCFNEPAFDRGRALYDGTLCGHPFRSVVKTFQVQVWREICAAHARLDAAHRARVAALLDVPADVFAAAR